MAHLRQRKLTLSDLDGLSLPFSLTDARSSSRLRNINLTDAWHVARAWPFLARVAIGILALLAVWVVARGLWTSSSGCDRVIGVSGGNCWWKAPRPERVNFIYIYKLPRRFHWDLIDATLEHNDPTVHVDAMLFRHLQRANTFITTDPEQATLFFLPVLPALFFRLQLPAASALPSAFPQSHEQWSALRATGQFVNEALQHVQTSFPYWRRHKGADHFIITFHPFGRCGLLPFSSPRLLGSTLSLLPAVFNDLRMRTAMLQTSDGQAQDWRGVDENLLCGRPDEDVVIPPLLPLSLLTHPRASNRTTFALVIRGPSQKSTSARFDDNPVSLPTGIDLSLQAGGEADFDRSFVRKGVMDGLKSGQTAVTWVAEDTDLQSSESSMRRAVVCICLPHVSNQIEMECMARAVLLGCIPVTFFHHYLHPWMHTYPFNRFSLNIDPMDVHEVAMRLEVIQLDVSMQWKLQAEVESVQTAFLYNDTLPHSALHQVIQALQNKASSLLHGEPLWSND